MKKKFWIAILTAVLLLNILPVMTPSAAADDTSSLETYTLCKKCNTRGYFPVIGFIPTPISSTPDPKWHWGIFRCTNCGNEGSCTGGEDEFRHIGGTETPTCTTGKTCEKCGGEYGKLGHIWGDWQSSGDNKTHTRSCQRDGCGAVETENCGGGNGTCVTLGTCTSCGGQYYGGHAFPARWKWYSDTEVGRDAESHWVWCLNCTEAKAYMDSHSFVQGNMYLKSPATCVSKPVYYVNCGTCHYKGTDTYEYQWGNVDPKNHTGVTEVRGAVEATCTQDGYTGDICCKDCGAVLTPGKAIPAAGHVGGTEVRGKKDADCTHDGYTGDTYCKVCDAKIATGKVIPAAGHTGSTATCCWPATCEVCSQGYGGMDAGNHLTGCKPEWIVTGTTHEQKYSYCGRIAAQKDAHTFGDWTVTQEAAAGKEGKQERVCTVCAYTETKVIPAKPIEASPTPTPVATPEPTAEPAEQPSESGSAWWWIIILAVIAGTGTGIAVWRKKKDKE